MCYMCVRPDTVDLPVEYVLAARRLGNKDGAGLMFVEGDRVVIRKVLGRTDAEVRELYEEHPGRYIAWHVRNQSVGPITLENCHPYWVTNKDWGHKQDVALMHNGTIQNVQVDPSQSDTSNFATFFLRPILAENPELYVSDEFWHMVSALIGRNKLILLNDKSQFVIVNAALGRIMEPYGVWVSSDTRLSPVKEDINLAALPSVIGDTSAPRGMHVKGYWVPEADGKEHFRIRETEVPKVTLEGLFGKNRDVVRELVRRFPDTATDFLFAALELMNASNDTPAAIDISSTAN